MVMLRKGLCIVSFSLASLSFSGYCADGDKPVFDQGSQHDFDNNIPEAKVRKDDDKERTKKVAKVCAEKGILMSLE